MNELVTVTELQTEQEQFINSIVKSKGANLPDTIDDVLNVFEFTDWKAKAWKTLSDKLARLDDQQEAYHSALRSGQQWGIAALYSQKRMGEITREMPKSITKRKADGTEIDIPEVGSKAEQLSKARVDKYAASDAERIAAHPDVLDSVIEKSKESNEIPTKTAVLREIRTRIAQSRATEHNAIQREKAVKQRPKIVADYFAALKQYRETLELAVEAARQGLFADESWNIIVKKHDALKVLMSQLERSIGGDDA